MSQTLPRAWRKLLEAQDELLVDLLAEEVEDLCGYKPDTEMVADYLRMQLGPQIVPRERQENILGPIASHQRPESDYARKPRSRRGGSYGFTLKGEQFTSRNKRGVLVDVLEVLSKGDETFQDRFMARKHGRKKKWVARTHEELYPNKDFEFCQRHSHCLRSGVWLGVNYSGITIRDILKVAAEVVGLKYGSELIVNLSEDDG